MKNAKKTQVNETAKTIDQLAAQLKEARDAIKKLEAQEKGISLQIKMMAEESESAALEGNKYLINLTERSRSSLDGSKVAKILTESQYKECTKVTSYVQVTVAAK